MSGFYSHHNRYERKMSLLIPSAHAQAAGAPPAGDSFGLIMLVGMMILFYFMLIRPQQKRQKEHQKTLDSLSVGDEVSTSAGLLGKVRKVDDNYVVLKVDENVELKFQKSSILAVLPKGTLKAI